jgi:AAA+ superfamily predicted ATPase
MKNDMNAGLREKSTNSGDFRGNFAADFARARAAKWLLGLRSAGLELDRPFFDCLFWVTGDPQLVVNMMSGSLLKMKKRASVEKAVSTVEKFSLYPDHLLSGEIVKRLNNSPCVEDAAEDAVSGILRMFCKEGKKLPASAVAAKKRLRDTFGLSEEAFTICEFVHLRENSSEINRYFVESAEVEDEDNRNLLAAMLGMKASKLAESLEYLEKCGAISTGLFFRLSPELDDFWSSEGSEAISRKFCRPFEGQSFALDSFGAPEDETAHASALIGKREGEPVHIVLYGDEGSGRTSFAASLASSLGMSALAVQSGGGDNFSKLSLVACIREAARRDGAFVVFDDADAFVGSDESFGEEGCFDEDFADFLDDLMSEANCSVVWIVGDVRGLDGCIQSRSSFSIGFKTRDDSAAMWRKVLAENDPTGLMTEDECERFAREYKVSLGVASRAVRQAQELGYDGDAFGRSVERTLRSHLMLCDRAPHSVRDSGIDEFYTPSGVCIEGSVDDLIKKCSRADAVYRASGTMPPGAGSMLFYGPPGTGKTALAKYIAWKLGRECSVKRASGIIDKYVGQTEYNLAEAFKKSFESGTVLLIDEADTFLFSRSLAQRSWETSMVNQFLTSLEDFRGFCICTTNKLKTLDAAAMRRFPFKVPFAYARPEQVCELYARVLAPLVGSDIPPDSQRTLQSLKRLAPGDFSAVRNQYWMSEPGELSHEELVHALVREQAAKTDDDAAGARGVSASGVRYMMTQHQNTAHVL